MCTCVQVLVCSLPPVHSDHCIKRPPVYSGHSMKQSPVYSGHFIKQVPVYCGHCMVQPPLYSGHCVALPYVGIFSMCVFKISVCLAPVCIGHCVKSFFISTFLMLPKFAALLATCSRSMMSWHTSREEGDWSCLKIAHQRCIPS